MRKALSCRRTKNNKLITTNVDGQSLFRVPLSRWTEQRRIPLGPCCRQSQLRHSMASLLGVQLHVLERVKDLFSQAGHSHLVDTPCDQIVFVTPEGHATYVQSNIKSVSRYTHHCEPRVRKDARCRCPGRSAATRPQDEKTQITAAAWRVCIRSESKWCRILEKAAGIAHGCCEKLFNV